MMNLSAICVGVACLALLTVPLETAAQLDSPAAAAALQRNVQAARVERLRKAMSDANTLEFLAAQLKAELAKSRPDTVSLSVAKRAEEIEKLARKIRTESEQNHYF
jgi:ATP-dependent helicase/DNAse subunit B